jgi:polysaccharide export outer membrane protein
MVIVVRVLIIGLVVLGAGCAGAGVNPHDVNEEFGEDLRLREAVYLVKPEDVLAVQVVGNDEFSRAAVTVSRDGYVSTPLGRFHVAGRSVAEIQALIKREQREFLTSPPPITVELVTQAPEVVWVGGEVDSPGVYTLRPSMSALEAVMEAGGNLPSGKMRNVILIRRGPEWRRIVRRVNLKVLEEDLVLMPRDVVYVPRTHIANVSTFVDQYITRVLPFNYYSALSFITAAQ